MNYLKIFLIGLCCIGFHSCDEDSFTQVVSLDIPEHVPKLSFSLEMSDIDTLIETFVSTSLDINADEDFPTISDAVVNMFKSDELFASLLLTKVPVDMKVQQAHYSMMELNTSLKSYIKNMVLQLQVKGYLIL